MSNKSLVISCFPTKYKCSPCLCTVYDVTTFNFVPPNYSTYGQAIFGVTHKCNPPFYVIPYGPANATQGFLNIVPPGDWGGIPTDNSGAASFVNPPQNLPPSSLAYSATIKFQGATIFTFNGKFNFRIVDTNTKGFYGGQQGELFRVYCQDTGFLLNQVRVAGQPDLPYSNLYGAPYTGPTPSVPYTANVEIFLTGAVFHSFPILWTADR